MNPNGETKDNHYFIVDTAPTIETRTIVLDNKGITRDLQARCMPVYITGEAVELIKEAEALALERYQIGKDKGNADSRRNWEKHNKLVTELMYLRRHTNPS